MLFRDLRLIAFGRFENQTLPLAPGLNVVFGPNEAGKSTTLRAIRSFLFGFGRSTPDNFRFAYPKLRVGATLSDGNGRELLCIRRKAVKDDLRRGDDSTILTAAEWDALAPPLDPKAFDEQFGVTYNSLLEGGMELAAGRGDLATALFTAAVGTGAFRKLQEQLRDQADELFKGSANAKTPLVNQGLAAARDLRQQITDVSLAASTWEQVERDRTAAEEGLRSSAGRLGEINARLTQLERQVDAIPLIHKRDGVSTALEGLRGAKRLPPDFSRRRQETQRLADRREAELAGCREHLERLAREIAAVDAPQELLARDRDVQELREALGSHRQAAIDLPIRVGELQQIEHEVRRGLQDLGRDQEAAADELQIPEPVRMRIERLSTEGTERLALERQLRTALAELEERRKQAARDLEEEPDEADAAGLRQTVKRLRSEAAVEAQYQKQLRALRKDEKLFLEVLERIGLANLTLDQFAKLPLPSPESIRRLQAEEDQARQTLEAARGLSKRLQGEKRKLDQERQRLADVEEFLDEDRLDALRKRRDEGWRLIRDVLSGGQRWLEDEAAYAAGPPPAADLAEAFERCLEKLDQTVDGLLEHSDKLSQVRALASRTQELHAAAEDAARDEAAAAETLAAWGKRWLAAWQPAGMEPGPPGEMLDWLHQARDLREKLANFSQLQREVEELGEGLAAVRAAALDAFPEALRAGREKTALARLLDELEAAVEERDAQQRRRQDARRDAVRREQEYERRREEHAQALREVDAWRKRWAEQLAVLAVEPDLTPSQATTLLGRMQQLVHKNDLADEKRRRIADMQGFMSGFEDRVARFLAQSAPDLVGQPLEAALAKVQQRLRAAQAADAQLRQLREQSLREQEKERTLTADRNAAKKELEALVREAGCTAVEELPEAERRSAERARLEELREQLDADLDRLSRSVPREEFVAACRLSSVERLEEEAARLRHERDELTRRREAQSQTIGEMLERQKAMNGGAAAADLQADLKAKLASVAPLAERYARLRLAEFLLRKTLEEYSRKHKDPVLERAASVFEELTCGRFQGLEVDASESEKPVLKGVRAGTDRTLVDVAGMSTGTRDQLFLALRIATLEIYFETHPPIPVMVDDILVMFDDERSAAALRVLQRLARSTQVLYFTHHQHLLEVAAAAVPQANVVRLER